LLAVHFQAAIAVQGSNGAVDFVAAAGGKVQAQGAKWAAGSKLQGICTACGRISRVGVWSSDVVEAAKPPLTEGVTSRVPSNTAALPESATSAACT
jgi:hypothetical protein